MKVINKTNVKIALATLNKMSTAKVVKSDFARCPMCRVSDG